MSLRQRNSTINSNGHSSIFIERKAIDASGQLGYFYDECNDSIIETSKIDNKIKPEPSENPVHCKILPEEITKSQNLLEMIGIQEHLRLNILLNLVTQFRIASIIHHPYPIDESTRFLVYSYENRKEKLPHEGSHMQEIMEQWASKPRATHIITSISYGIDIVVVLHPSSDNVSMAKIDNALERVHKILNGTSNSLTLSFDDDQLFQQNTIIFVYSNISLLNRMTSMGDICKFVNDRTETSIPYRPISYTLTSIQQYTESETFFMQLPLSYNDQLEQYLLHYVDTLKNMKYSIDYKVSRLLGEYLGEQLSKLRQQWVNLKNIQETNIKRLEKLICDSRCGQCDISMIDPVLNDNEQITFDDDELHALEEKGKFILDLRQKQFQYCNVADHGINRKDDETSIEQKLISNDQHVAVLCSNDTLNKKHPQQFEKMLDKLIKKQNKQANLRLVYADFSYCSYPLSKILFLPLSSTKKKETLSANSEIMNILLLGESGVGKSTFINAFANYLTFNTLQEAEQNEPVVLMPVSFLITTGQNFDEQTVKFGTDDDELENENFDHPGQSVTQRCKSYIFSLHHLNGKKLRIIDTPGFGDTRGVDQDDRNIEHILEYMKNISHLNAICFLLKPNESRLHIFFRSCITQLFSLLGEHIGHNILFCFTNSRSTFYAPGDTGPLLKEMVNSLSNQHVSYNKENTFCFDNESFRYLVTLQNNIKFTELEKSEYEKSWSTSVTQSNRLINHIDTKLIPYPIDSNRRSIRCAQLEILHMVRPILETMRNILRNRVIQVIGHPNQSFELHAKPISHLSTICMSCTPYPLQVGPFLIAHNLPHENRKNCSSCRCTRDQHYSIDYLLHYEFLNDSSRYHSDQMDKLMRNLCNASVDFAYFLINIEGASKNDPFFTGLIQMITEEKYLCDHQRVDEFNLKLVEDLRELHKEYDGRMNAVVRKQKQKTLDKIYKLINEICAEPFVHEQIIVAKEGQKAMVKQYEYEVPSTQIDSSF